MNNIINKILQKSVFTITILSLTYVTTTPASAQTEQEHKLTITHTTITKDENLSNEKTFISTQVTTDRPFNLAVIKMSKDDLNNQEISIKLSENNKTSDWVKLKKQENQTGETTLEATNFSEPIMSHSATGYQIKSTSLNGDLPKKAEVVTINSNPTPEKNIHKTETTTKTTPNIISREQWGADETKMTWNPEKIINLKSATIVHTVTSNNYTNENITEQIRAIYKHHAVNLAWGDIGYHFLVDKFGNIYEGRKGSITGLNVASHTFGFNKNSLGIAALGNFEPNVANIPETQPSQQLLESIGNVIAWKLNQYNTNTNGRTNLIHSNNGSQKNVPVIHGQKDLQSTLSPGKYLYEKLDTIRNIANN